MSTHLRSTARRLCGAALLAGVTAIGLPAISSAETFYAQPDSSGIVNVVDSSGAPVSVVYGDPVGTKPGICPYGAYYFTDFASDKSELGLTDCATGQNNYPVEILSSTD